MPHPAVLPRPRLAPPVARLVLAAAIIAGLFGMHVLMSPGAHAAHAAPSIAPSSAAVEQSAATHGDMSAHTTSRAAADAAGPQTELVPRHASGVWAVVCVLALLLTVLLAARPAGRWLTSRRPPAWAAVDRATGDRGPRHPPSLIALCISRT